MSRRSQLLLLSAIVLVGLLRGGWWVAVTEVMSPIDEAAHVDYVAAVANHGRPPTVGRDLVRNEVLELAKASATSPWRPSPLTSDHDDPKWGAFAHSYEGVQPPVYYLALAPPWKLLHGYGELTMLYILRSLGLLMALATVPLLWLLGRELFPDRPEIALGAPALLVMLGGFNANVASVGNDSLVMPLSVAALWFVARTWRKGFGARGAVAAGALVGAAVLTKTTALALVPLVAVGALGPLWTRGTVARRYIAWGAQAGGVAALFVVPWLLWNRATYGAWSAAEAVDKITGPLQPPIPRTFDGVVMHLKSSVQAFWGAQLAVRLNGHYAVFWSVAGALILAVAVVVHARRRRPTRDALAIAWMASAVPLALLTMIGIIVGVFGGSSSVVGRHLYPALPALLLAIVAALFTVAGRRIGAVVLVGLIAVGLTLERADTDRYVRGTYTRGVEQGLTPVAGHGRGDTAVAGPLSVRLEAGCPIGGVGVEFAGDVPSLVTVRADGQPLREAAHAITRPDAGRGTFAFFPIPANAEALNVEIPTGTQVSAGLPSPRARTLVPVAFAYCRTDDPAADRFAALFHPQHPDWSLGATYAWPDVWIGLGWIGFAATVIAALRPGLWRRAQGASKTSNASVMH